MSELYYKYTTLAIDASVSGEEHKRDRTGFAYYIRDDSGATKHAWYEDKKYTSAEAETIALIEGLKACFKKEQPKNSCLIIYADNMTVITIINKGFVQPRKVKKWEPYSKMVHSYLSHYDKVEARHVPAHTGRSDLKRYHLNYWCDINSRAMMRHGRYHVDRKAEAIKERKTKEVASE